MYLGFNYDLARGIQEELLRWADEQRKVKRVRSNRKPEELLTRSEPDLARPVGEEEVARRRAS